jgi:hypothetical protein
MADQTRSDDKLGLWKLHGMKNILNLVIRDTWTGKDITILPAIPGHRHAIDADGILTCGCRIKWKEIALSLRQD